MAQVFTELDERLIKFIASQPMFFVATAPSLNDSGGGGHVNVSPKGYRDTFAVLDRLTVAYLDLTGSGAETIAHLRQNGRITIMFCSFAREPKILRLYGTGDVVVPAEPRWQELAASFPWTGDGEPAPGESHLGTGTDRGQRRAIIVVNLDRIADSCGYAVLGWICSPNATCSTGGQKTSQQRTSSPTAPSTTARASTVSPPSADKSTESSNSFGPNLSSGQQVGSKAVADPR